MDFSYRWVIVGVGALMTCVAIGAMFSLAVFLDPMATATGWSRAGISSAMTLNFIVMGLGAFGWGAMSDRFGTRIALPLAAILVLGSGAAERHSGDRASSSQNASRQSTIGCRCIGVFGSRAWIGWQPTSKSSAKEKAVSARRKSVADNELDRADAKKEVR